MGVLNTNEAIKLAIKTLVPAFDSLVLIIRPFTDSPCLQSHKKKEKKEKKNLQTPVDQATPRSGF